MFLFFLSRFVSDSFFLNVGVLVSLILAIAKFSSLSSRRVVINPSFDEANISATIEFAFLRNEIRIDLNSIGALFNFF